MSKLNSKVLLDILSEIGFDLDPELFVILSREEVVVVALYGQ
jgi:hypothetical protein